MRHLLNWIRKEYDNPEVFVTENGVSDQGDVSIWLIIAKSRWSIFIPTGGLNDTRRVFYFNSYLSSILGAIKDGCNIKGYIAWSLMDSFEWKAGFTEKFGMYHVDFTHPNRTRTQKLSAKVYSNIVKTNRIDWNYLPKLESSEMSPFSSGGSSIFSKSAHVLGAFAVLASSSRFLWFGSNLECTWLLDNKELEN